MEKYKVLNLYACLGGNRYKWDEVAKQAGIEIEVTAVELDEVAAELYQERFPNDKVIVADAHQYLLENFKQFDFIWSSPPCPSHSRARYWNSSNYETTTEAIYPDMKLYEEILFLQHYYRTGKYVVENVIPYYEPLIQA
jgi:DNA (cytosine-5)-methyltransferase 1